MKFNVKQFRRELNQVIAVAEKEIQERQTGIEKAKQTLRMLDSFDLKTKGGKVTKISARPTGTVGITEAIKKVLKHDVGMPMRAIINGTLEQKPYTTSVDPAGAITATVAGLLARGHVRRKQTKDGYVYFSTSKPAKPAAQAAA